MSMECMEDKTNHKKLENLCPSPHAKTVLCTVIFSNWLDHRVGGIVLTESLARIGLGVRGEATLILTEHMGSVISQTFISLTWNTAILSVVNTAALKWEETF